jgi:hypothetical protein
MFVDADEVPTQELVEDIRSLRLGSADVATAAFDVDVRYVFLGRELRFGHRISKRVLLDRTRCAFPEVDDLGVLTMWEVEGHYQPLSSGPIAQLHGKLLHHDVAPLFDFFARHNRYSDWEAHMRNNPTVRRHVAGMRSRQGQLFEKVPGKPILFFLYCYIARRGFLDGLPGFAYAVSYSFYLWQSWIKSVEQRW